MRILSAHGVLACSLLACAMPVLAGERETCLMEQLSKAADGMTLGELRALCAQTRVPQPDPAPPAASLAIISQRYAEEAKIEASPYAITPHRQNYILLASYNQKTPDSTPYSRDVQTDGPKAKKLETKFQLSVKVPVLVDLFGGQGDVYAGYTQRSFWQFYNKPASSPFRETNYEPELWYQHKLNLPVLGWNLSGVALGFNHQSNGRGQAFSRSWNRVFAMVALERGQVAMALRPWWRVKEKASTDDNPDIEHVMGNFDLTLVGKAGANTWDLMVRNNLHRHGNRGAMQLGWSFPLNSRLRGYLQWFKGYGESLVDYNRYQNAVSMGVQLTDW